jgi:glycerol-3-phosphate acyltransferase PlsY
LIEALLVVAGYLCGSLPFGYWLVRCFAAPTFAP